MLTEDQLQTELEARRGIAREVSWADAEDWECAWGIVKGLEIALTGDSRKSTDKEVGDDETPSKPN